MVIGRELGFRVVTDIKGVGFGNWELRGWVACGLEYKENLNSYCGFLEPSVR